MDVNQKMKEHEDLVLRISLAIKRRLPSQVSVDELVAAGSVGLWNAIKKYDPTRNIKLQTYAARKIRGAILDYIREIDPLTRVQRRNKLPIRFVSIDKLDRDYEWHPNTFDKLEDGIEPYMKGLTAAEKTVMRGIYNEGLKQWEVAKAMKLSPGRINQIRITAIAIIRESLKEKGNHP